MHDQAKTLIYSIGGNKAKKDKNPFYTRGKAARNTHQNST
jgi:hypothetical protein